jgi:hypothetical protein
MKIGHYYWARLKDPGVSGELWEATAESLEKGV